MLMVIIWESVSLFDAALLDYGKKGSVWMSWAICLHVDRCNTECLNTFKRTPYVWRIVFFSYLNTWYCFILLFQLLKIANNFESSVDLSNLENCKLENIVDGIEIVVYLSWTTSWLDEAVNDMLLNLFNLLFSEFLFLSICLRKFLVSLSWLFFSVVTVSLIRLFYYNELHYLSSYNASVYLTR